MHRRVIYARPNLTGELAGKRIGHWLVMAYAGQRNGLPCWKCMCCTHWLVKIIPEQDLLDRKANTLFSPACHQGGNCRCQSDSVYGEWTVLGQATAPEGSEGGHATLWKCRCVCGVERDIPENDLTSLRTLSCGCRSHGDVRAELGWWHDRAWQALRRAGAADKRHSREGRFDNKWTRDMEGALRRFQPVCVLCPATEDLTTHHVRPLSGGHGLEPGNAVRLCRACNSFICNRDPSELSPGQARKLETAAAQFKEFWASGCATPVAPTVVPPEEAPKPPDPALVALLRAMECGDKTAIPALASWLDERGDPRAGAIRDVLTRSGPLLTSAEYEVWQRLGLSWNQSNTLKQYLGINPIGVATTIEEIAKREGKRVQTIRGRIELALYRLTVPSPHRHCRD